MNPFGFDSLERRVSSLERTIHIKADDEDFSRLSHRLSSAEQALSSKQSSLLRAIELIQELTLRQEATKLEYDCLIARHESLVLRVEALKPNLPHQGPP